MDALLIYNPYAGNKSFSGELDYTIGKFQDKGVTLSVYRLGGAGALDKFLAAQKEKYYERVIIAGGDGTVSIVAAALLKQGIDVPLGIIPIGITNDFAKHFNLPADVGLIADIIRQDNYAEADVARVNGEILTNAALIGVKEFQGLSPCKIKLESEDFIFEGEIFLALVMNGKSAGGFSRIMQGADIDDGLLDVLIIKKCPLAELGPILLSLGGGKYKESGYIKRFRADHIEISSETRVSARVDGEEGFSLPLKIAVSGKKLKISADPKRMAASTDDNFSFNEVMRAAGGVVEIIKDMPRHNVLEYINKGAIGSAFFKEAEDSLDDGYLYIVLSSTGTAAGELIRSVTKKNYSHVSLSFDSGLKTLISYNGGGSLFAPGMNHELLKFLYKKEDANLLVYKIKATREQKRKALDEVEKIDKEGSSYNLIGLLLPYSHRENIMFCSQFVYHILKTANLSYFEKDAYDVKPMDFVELDLRRALEFHSQIYLRDVIRQ